MLTTDTITELNRLNDYSTTKYGPFVDDCHAWGALRSEYLEVEEAAQRRDHAALRAELMDLANVATRWAEALAIKPIGVPFDTNETPEQIEIRQLKQDAHYDHVAAAERIAELEREVAALKHPAPHEPTNHEIDTMARVLCDAYLQYCGLSPSTEETLSPGWHAEARAACAYAAAHGAAV